MKQTYAKYLMVAALTGAKKRFTVRKMSGTIGVRL
jgi:ribosomal protein L19